MPQIIMMNHAAWYNGEKTKRRVEGNDDGDGKKKKRRSRTANEPGCPNFDAMTSEQIASYVMNWEK